MIKIQSGNLKQEFILNGTNNINNKSEDYYTILLNSSLEYNYALKLLTYLKLTITATVSEIHLIQLKCKMSDILKVKKYTHSFINRSHYHTVSSSDSINKPYSKHIQWDVIKSTDNYRTHLLSTGSPKYCVAIIDSGIQLNHPDLKDNIVSIKNMVPKGGFRGLEPDETGYQLYMEDKLDHGTRVAGQICANGNITSIAPNTGLKVFRIFGGKSADNIWIMKAIVEAAKDPDVSVINLSLGNYLIDSPNTSDSNSLDGETEILAYQKAIHFAEKQGCLIVGALGNDGINIDDNSEFLNKVIIKDDLKKVAPTSYVYDLPSQQKGVIGVASSDSNGSLSSYSNISNNYMDVLSYGGDNRLLEKHGYKKWLKNNMIQSDWVLTTSSKHGYTYAVGNSLACGKVSSSIAALNHFYKIYKDPDKTKELLYGRLQKVLKLSDLLRDC